VVSTVDL